MHTRQLGYIIVSVIHSRFHFRLPFLISLRISLTTFYIIKYWGFPFLSGYKICYVRKGQHYFDDPATFNVNKIV